MLYSPRLLYKVLALHRNLYLCIMFYLQIASFREWACLDSNQGPLPYQGSKGTSAASCSVRVSGLLCRF